MEPDTSEELESASEPQKQLENARTFSKLAAALAVWQKGASGYILSRWLFLRLLGVAYFCAFLSFWSQAAGLIGENGILPAGGYLDGLKAYAGPAAYWMCPTLTWFNASNLFIQFL